jgi:hypothetical protein
VRYRAGDTRHFDLAPSQYLLNGLENLSAEPLSFVTVEHRPSIQP